MKDFQYIDNGFYYVTKRTAELLVGKLPRLGYEKAVELDKLPKELQSEYNTSAWLKRTLIGKSDKQAEVWAVQIGRRVLPLREVA